MQDGKVLIVASTELEIKNLLVDAEKINDQPLLYQKRIGNVDTHILIGGIGTAFMAYKLTKTLSQHKYSFVINVGIGGAFSNLFALGEVLNVHNEIFAGVGLLDKEKFTNLFEMKLLTEGEFPFTQNFMHNFSLINNKVIEALPLANGVTVNTLFTRSMGADLRYEKLNPHIETMEGAAVFYVCLMEHVPFVQIRAISNYVGETNKNLWKIPLAVDNLHKKLIDILSELQ
ncbi:MAG: futalosine hydrolase [Bacteroidales bacterium]|nr:futalosine hydrolase [Bacteroidales bacterium]